MMSPPWAQRGRVGGRPRVSNPHDGFPYAKPSRRRRRWGAGAGDMMANADVRLAHSGKRNMRRRLCAHGQNKLRVIGCGPLRPALAVPRASAAGMGYCNDARRNNSTAAKPSAVRTTCSVVSASRDWNIWVDVPPEHCSRSRRSLAAPNEPKPWRRKKRCCARS